MDLAEALAREEIRAVLVRYNHAGDRGRLDELVRCFADDGVLQIAGEEPLSGREAIERRLLGVREERRAGAERPLVRHHVSSVHIELLAPDRARAWSYFFVITEAGPDHWGRYVDRLRRAPDGWRIAHRRVVTEGVAPGARMARRR